MFSPSSAHQSGQHRSPSLIAIISALAPHPSPSESIDQPLSSTPPLPPFVHKIASIPAHSIPARACKRARSRSRRRAPHALRGAAALLPKSPSSSSCPVALAPPRRAPPQAQDDSRRLSDRFRCARPLRAAAARESTIFARRRKISCDRRFSNDLCGCAEAEGFRAGTIFKAFFLHWKSSLRGDSERCRRGGGSRGAAARGPATGSPRREPTTGRRGDAEIRFPGCRRGSRQPREPTTGSPRRFPTTGRRGDVEIRFPRRGCAGTDDSRFAAARKRSGFRRFGCRTAPARRIGGGAENRRFAAVPATRTTPEGCRGA